MTLYYDPVTKRAKVVVYAGLDERGRQRQRSKTWTSPNERKARREAASRIHELRMDIAASKERIGTVGHLVDVWQKHRDAIDSPSTIRGRHAVLERIRDRFGAMRLDELSARHVDTWYSEMREEGLRPSTIANHHGQLRAILRQGDKWDMCTDAATRRASPPSRRPAQREVLPVGALNVLLDSATPDLALCAHLLAVTGMRRGELMALLWSDIDPDRPLLHITKAVVVKSDGKMQVQGTKTGRTRTVEVGDGTICLLMTHRGQLLTRASAFGAKLPENGPIIADIAADPTGRTPRHPNWLTVAWSRHCRRHGVKMRVHDLRHWHASQLIDAGVPVSAVSARLGHASTAMTLNTYTHALASADERAAATIDRVLSLGTGV